MTPPILRSGDGLPLGNAVGESPWGYPAVDPPRRRRGLRRRGDTLFCLLVRTLILQPWKIDLAFKKKLNGCGSVGKNRKRIQGGCGVRGSVLCPFGGPPSSKVIPGDTLGDPPGITQGAPRAGPRGTTRDNPQGGDARNAQRMGPEHFHFGAG